MSEVRDLDGDAQDRDGMNVAQEPRERIEVSRLMDPSSPLIPGPAGQEMDMEPEMRSPGPSEESPRRGEETGGGDSSLTNLRGGAGSPYSDDNSLHSSTRQLATLLHPNPNSPRTPYPDSQHVVPHPEGGRADHYYPPTPANTYSYQHMPVQMRPDHRQQATPFDYPHLGTYDPMSHPPYTGASSSSQTPSQSYNPHPHPQAGIGMPWEYQYQQHQHPHQATGHMDRHGQHPMYPTGYPDPSSTPNPNQQPQPTPGPSHHLPHPHQHQHPPDQNQYNTFPLVRDPYPHPPTGVGYAFSDPQVQSQYLPSHNYDPPPSASGSGTGTASGSASGSGHVYKERGASFDSATPSKKPITTSRLGLDPAAKQERRREQNRVAQRAFRARAKIREQERSDDYDDDNQNEDVFDAR